MISKEVLVAFLVSLPAILDYERPVRLPIPRSAKVAEVIAVAALETDDPIGYAIDLDVLGAHESAYNVSLVGDHNGGVARSCGAWQTPCERTPGFTSSECAWGNEGYDPNGQPYVSDPECHHGWKFHPSSHVALAQARIAVSILRTARANCPNHPIWRYASGQCMQTRTASLYEVDEANETQLSTSFRDPR